MGSLESVLDKDGFDRVVHRFQVPASIGGDIRSIGLVELTAEEELQVEMRCKGSSERRASEIAKASIHELNGKRAHNGNGDIDRFWNRASPKLRSLVNTAWVRAHLANDEEVESFFSSKTTSI